MQKEELLEHIKVDRNGCWIWQRATVRGYGSGKIGKCTILVHRAVYTLFVGPIPGGMVLHHLCRKKTCANPDHLELCTQRENLFHDDTVARRNAAKTHCKRGHLFSGANLKLRVTKRGTERICRKCVGISSRARQQRLKQQGKLFWSKEHHKWIYNS